MENAFYDILNRLGVAYECDRHTDRRTDRDITTYSNSAV